ncbi:hypothetical protein AB6A40_001204 [Gnathostoma spinigerum]|uniref:Uncharacterized protein n=1 Tax=Gnathostoma spinigerum TaxID=75299 RepID=A0ABD6E3P0_9BILA
MFSVCFCFFFSHFKEIDLNRAFILWSSSFILHVLFSSPTVFPSPHQQFVFAQRSDHRNVWELSFWFETDETFSESTLSNRTLSSLTAIRRITPNFSISVRYSIPFALKSIFDSISILILPISVPQIFAVNSVFIVRLVGSERSMEIG